MRDHETPTPESLTRSAKVREGHEMRPECSERFVLIEKDLDVIAGNLRHLDAVLHGTGTDKRGGLVMEMERFTTKMNAKLNLLIVVVLFLCGLSYPKVVAAVKDLVVR